LPLEIEGQRIEPGATFSASLDPKHEAFLMDIGAIALMCEPVPVETWAEVPVELPRRKGRD
jgi:hypothetical protein